MQEIPRKSHYFFLKIQRLGISWSFPELSTPPKTRLLHPSGTEQSLGGAVSDATGWVGNGREPRPMIFWEHGNTMICFFPAISCNHWDMIWWKDICSVEVDEPWWSTLERQASSLYCLALAGTSCHKRKWGLTRIVQSTSHLSGEACWIIAGRKHGFCCPSLLGVVGYYIILYTYYNTI